MADDVFTSPYYERLESALARHEAAGHLAAVALTALAPRLTPGEDQADPAAQLADMLDHPIARHGVGREEPERVEVGAAQIVRLHDGIRPLPAQPQRHGMPVLALPVDHRPLVHAEAAERARSPARAPQHRVDRRDELGLLGAERGAVHDERPGFAARPVPPPRRAGIASGAVQLAPLAGCQRRSTAGL